MGYRLKDAIRVEPLVFGWPAWWCNIAPATAALHAHRYQIPALTSYLRNPAAHFRAASDPALAGGSFVGIPPERSGYATDLLERMKVEYASAKDFSETWLDFGEEVRKSAVGATMEGLYPSIPGPLQGLVELGYDYDNRPSVRLEEGLAYESELYRRERQGVALRVGAWNDQRCFYMSTPLFAEDGVRADVPLGDPALAALVALDVAPASTLDEARRILAEATRGAAVPSDWLVEAPPLATSTYDGEGTRLRYIGHACVLAEHRGSSVLVDPLIPQGDCGEGIFGFGDLPERIELVLVTHAHPDHFDIETLLRLRPRVSRIAIPRHLGLLVGDVSLKRVLREIGYEDVLEVGPAESIRLASGEVFVLPFLGEHGDVLHGSKATYAVHFDRTRMLFAADSTCLDARMYERIRRYVGGPIEHVFMNTEVDGAPLSWPFDALFPRRRDRKLEATRKCRGSNVEEGLRLLEAVEAKNLYLYAMGLEPWVERITGPASSVDSPRMRAAEELVTRTRERGLGATIMKKPAELFLGR